MAGYVLAGTVYATKDAIVAQLRSILHGAQIGVPLTGPSRDKVLEVLDWHPDADEKIGAGVQSVVVEEAVFKTRAFIIERIDGSRIDFSFIKAIREHETRRSLLSETVRDFKQAARMAVLDDVRNFRTRRLVTDPHCAVTNIPLTLADTHVDHTPPLTFDALLYRFCLECHLDLSSVGIIDHGMTRTFADGVLAATWRAYHNNHARLRLVHRKTNLRLKKSPRVDWEALTQTNHEGNGAHGT